MLYRYKLFDRFKIHVVIFNRSAMFNYRWYPKAIVLDATIYFFDNVYIFTFLTFVGIIGE